MPVSLIACCQPSQPVLILIMNGTDDALILWNGGLVADNPERGSTVSTDETMAFWRDVNQCVGGTVAVDVDDTAIDVDSRVTRIETIDCEAATVLYRIEGGGHRVPRDRFLFGARILDASLGVQNEDIHAATEIWRFFDRAVPYN